MYNIVDGYPVFANKLQLSCKDSVRAFLLDESGYGFCGSSDGIVCVVHVAGDLLKEVSAFQHGKGLRAIEFDSKRQVLFVGDQGGRVAVIELVSGKVVCEQLSRHF